MPDVTFMTSLSENSDNLTRDNFGGPPTPPLLRKHAQMLVGKEKVEKERRDVGEKNDSMPDSSGMAIQSLVSKIIPCLQFFRIVAVRVAGGWRVGQE